MDESIEYQLFVGCSDSQTLDYVIDENELKETIAKFFKRKNIDFSMLRARGGYLNSDGTFITEQTVCINIIGNKQLDIIKLAKSLTMYMNQESTLVVKNKLNVSFR